MSKPTKVLILNEGDDTGSVGIRIKQAFDRWGGPDWEVRAVRTSDNYARHDFDIHGWPLGPVRDLYQQADVVHWMEQFRGIRKLGPNMVRDNPKPAVLHHHGEIARDERDTLLATAAEMHAVQLVATLDLLALGPGMTWLPSPYNLEWLRSFRKPVGGLLPTLFHSPTVRSRKGTAELEAVVAAMRAHRPVNLEIVEFRDQQFCLTRKGQADIVWDGPYGYGLNAIEAFAMGIPVMAGLVPSRYSTERTRQDIIEHIGFIPFYEFNWDNLTERLEAMLDDSSLRKEWGEKGQVYANEKHDDRIVVEQLKGIYHRAIDQFQST